MFSRKSQINYGLKEIKFSARAEGNRGGFEKQGERMSAKNGK